ncbi:MAG: ATP-dependent RecD-like DNA helicase [Verrucomicrobia bacterium]|nr:ATP-dependent RecD-like DNA helicase [Verrucomicrobiota bacterium]
MATAAPAPPPATLSGVIERIIFRNEENHYTIAELRPDSPSPAPAGSKPRPEPVTVVGPLPGVECGETLHLTGEWTRHAQHGAQFRLATFRSELPSSVYGIRKYLGSGLVPGIGRIYAEKIVDAFGTATLRVLSEESGRLREIRGIGRKRAAAIKQAWDAKRTERELYIFLQTYGVTPAQCVKLVGHFGADARRILSTEPYRAAREIEGIGFKTADRIALNLGFANDAPPRLDAGLIYALETLQEEGHTAFPEEALVAHTAALLETREALVAARVGALLEKHAILRHPADAAAAPARPEFPRPAAERAALLQLPSNDRAEQKIADAVYRLTRVPSGLPPIKVAAAVQWAEQRAGFAFDELQRAAVRAALSHKLSILTGGPGTGKTTCLRALVDILKAKQVRLHLAAPTGRAAQRLAESTGGFASTIHRLLHYDAAAGGFVANEHSPLTTDFLVIDEASMLDSRLAAALFQAVPSRAHLLLVGDTDQLPSVGAGTVLKDLIAAGAPAAPGDPAAAFRIPTTRLAVIHRQQKQSQIVISAHAINSGDPLLPPTVPDVASAAAWGDLTLIVAPDPEECARRIIQLCTEYIPRHWKWFHPIDDVQVLAPMHKGVAGVANLNLRLQEALNGPASRGAGAHRHSLRTASGEYRPGDKVIQLRNNYDKNLFNGDIGTVAGVDPEGGTLEADFDGERHSFTRSELGDLALAYAISIHKSQGSEYPVVIVPLLKAHFMMLQRNLLYTAITRGRKKVFLVGDPAAYAMAVRNSESKLRVTHLQEKIELCCRPRPDRR